MNLYPTDRTVLMYRGLSASSPNLARKVLMCMSRVRVSPHVVVAPNLPQQVLPGDHPVAVEDEELKQFKFFEGQLQGSAIPEHLMAVHI